MPEETIYVADTSALIEIQKKYPHDVFKTIWDNLSKLADKERIIAPKQVLEEINLFALEDYLKKWAVGHKKIFKEQTSFQLSKVREILLLYPKMAEYKKGHEQADPYVVALALDKDPQTKLVQNNKRSVVTEEKSVRGKPEKIPDVCSKFGVEFFDILGFFRQEGWRF